MIVAVTLSATAMTVVQSASDAVYLLIPLVEPGGEVVDLSDITTAIAIVRAPDGTKTEETLVVTDAIGGIVRYDTPATFFATAGRWKIQVKVSWPDGGIFYSPAFKIKVKANL